MLRLFHGPRDEIWYDIPAIVFFDASVLVMFRNFLFLAWVGFNEDTPCVVVY